MPALEKSQFTGLVTWVGTVPDRAADLASHGGARIDLDFAGPKGEDHGGLTRPSCSRVIQTYPRGTEIRNVRQLCVMSAEELAEIAKQIDVPRFDPAWAGCNLVIEGIPDFSHIPPSSRLQFSSGATITVDMLNQPCHLPAPVINRSAPHAGKGFKQAAEGRRGVTAWVERVGAVQVGDAVVLHLPTQRPWRGGQGTLDL